jgi:hypothetical protein
MAAQKIEFTVKNVKGFSSWIKRFSSINNSMLLEIDEKNEMFSSKSYDEEHSIVKSSKTKFSEVEFSPKTSGSLLIKVGIFNIPRLVKILDHFNNSEFSFIITYDELITKDTTELVGTSWLLKNKDLKVSEECTPRSIFDPPSDEKFESVIASVDTVIAEFDLNVENIDKVNSLSKLEESDAKFLDFKRGANVYVCGQSFELLVKDIDGEWNGEEEMISIFKDQFDCVDVENYKVTIGNDRLVFRSKDSETVTVLSEVVKD